MSPRAWKDIKHQHQLKDHTYHLTVDFTISKYADSGNWFNFAMLSQDYALVMYISTIEISFFYLVNDQYTCLILIQGAEREW